MMGFCADATRSCQALILSFQQLDDLLQQGSSQLIKDEIIGMSEEFHIITPYTSLLVLETDEDRERFGVKRRFEMRDGERFFADGRDDANYELTQKVMREAGNWRLGLRYQVLRQLAQLGRNLQIVKRMKQLAGPQQSLVISGTASEISSANWSGVRGRGARLPSAASSSGFGEDMGCSARSL